MATLKKNAETKVKEEVKAEKKATQKAEKKSVAKKPATKKSTAKATTTKTAVKKEVVAVQFAGNEYDVEAIVEAAKADFKANNKGCLRSIKVYIKPEDNTAYYVVNSKVEGKVSL